MSDVAHGSSDTSIKFKHQHLENEYLRTYVRKQGPQEHEDGGTSPVHPTVVRQADKESMLADVSAGKELTTQVVNKFIRRNATQSKLPGPAQQRVEALLSRKKAKKKKAVLISQRTWFTSIIGVAVIANAVQLGVEVDYPDHRSTYAVLEHMFTGIFSLEMIFKLVELRVGYFKDPWNLVDFILVWLSIVDIWILTLISGTGDGPDLRIFSMLRILRILRLLRAVRLFKVFRELWRIVKGILNSLRAVSWTAMLLIFLLYICGVFCCVVVGKNTTAGYLRFEDEMEHIDEIGRDFDVYQFYGTVPRAMYTLFETCIEPLNIRPVIERQPWMVGFFFIFIFISTFGVLNVIIGVIVEHTMSTSEENKNAAKVRQFEEKMDKLEIVRDSCFGMDDDGNLTLQQIQKAFEMPLVLDTMEEVELPLGLQPEELFNLLDADGNGKVSYEQMMMELTRATVHNEHQQLLDLKIGLHSQLQMQHETQRQIRDITAGLAELRTQVHYGFCQLLPTEKMQSWPTGPCLSSNPDPSQLPQPMPVAQTLRDLSSNPSPCSRPGPCQWPEANGSGNDQVKCSSESNKPSEGTVPCQTPLDSNKRNPKADSSKPFKYEPLKAKNQLDNERDSSNKKEERISPEVHQCSADPLHHQTSYSSSVQPPEKDDLLHIFKSPSTPPPQLPMSDMEAPPPQPNAEPPLRPVGPGLNQPCDISNPSHDPLREVEPDPRPRCDGHPIAG